MYQLSLGESLVPAQLDGELLDSTVGSVFLDAVAASPESVFLREMSKDGERLRTWTYAETGRRVERLAEFLSLRFEPGERIIVCAANSADWVLLQFGVALARLILVPVNPASRIGELRYVAEHSQAVAIFACRMYRGIALIEVAERVAGEVRQIRGVFDLENLAEFADLVASRAKTTESRPRNRDTPRVRPEDPTQIQYTSGTTGRPKGAVISNHAFTNNARLCFERLGIGPGSTLLHFMPLFHTGGCGFLLLGALQRGVTLVLLNGFDPALVNRLVQQERVTVLLGVPTMLIGMLETFDREPRNVESLKWVLMGGSTVSAALVRRVRDTFDTQVAVLYGQTETSSNMTCTWPTDAAEDIATCVGQPLPRTEMSIRDPRSGAVLPIGCIGEICVRSYTRLIEYHGDPAATSQALDTDGWLHTGDLGSLDRRGYLAITGRLKDMIIRGGENIYPAEIEALLAKHPDVAEAAGFGAPDERWGEVVVCCVRPRDGREVDPEKLAKYCRQHLTPAKVPLHWRAVEQWPLTGSGKIQKFALREEFAAQQRAMTGRTRTAT